MSMCQSPSPNSSPYTLCPLGIHVCSLPLCLYFCFANKVTSTIFPDFTFVLIYIFPLSDFTLFGSL